MAVITHLKETDSNCKGFSGWVAFGQNYLITTTKEIGTDQLEYVWGWVDTRHALGDLSRKSTWRYTGQGINISFQNEMTGQTHLFRRNLKYRFIKMLFCGCGIGEVECVDCCIDCCSVAGEILNIIR